MPDDLIIIGASARAAAQSAIRAGYRPWCIDLFADRDLRAVAPVKRCPAERWPDGVIELLDDAPDAPDAPVLWTGAMENHLDVVRRVEARHAPWGDGADAMRSARDLHVIDEACALTGRPGVGTPERWSQERATAMHPAILDATAAWIAKPLRSAGGKSVRRWRVGDPLAPHEYIQRFIEGVSLSAVYGATTTDVRVLGMSEQIIGDAAFGAADFLYVGNIVATAALAALHEPMRQVGQAIAQRAGLHGVFGVDAIATGGGVCIIEVNPRYVASVEMIERSTDIAALRGALGRLAATRRGALPDGASAPLRVAAKRAAGEAEGCNAIVGKAIIYAKSNCTVPDLYDIFAPDEVADVPDIGATFRTGQPICTVFARGGDRDECLARLREMAGRVYTRVLHE